MIKMPVIACLLSMFVTGVVIAGEHCSDPVSEWQSQETLRQLMESHGWKVRRVKVDDDCYEVHGSDPNGNRFEAKFFPATLKIRSLEIEFEEGSESGMDLLQRLYQR